MLDENFVILGALISAIGTVSYVVATLKGKTKPNRVTWILWAVAPLVVFAAQLNEGVGLRGLMTFMVGFGPLLVVIASFVNRQSYWKMGRLDWTCGLLSVVALLAWAITKEGNVAIFLSILADALAGVPTLIKAYKHPETERSLVFLLGAASAGITLFTIDTWNFANYGFPAYILVLLLTIAAVVTVGHRRAVSV